MVDVEDLAERRLSDLGRWALDACARRFRELACQAQRPDQPLVDLLHKMALEAETQSSMLAGGGPPHDPPGDTRRLAGPLIRALSRSTGEAAQSRDVALFLAEGIVEEAANLFGRLSEYARRPDLRASLLELSCRERNSLRFLWEVLL